MSKSSTHRHDEFGRRANTWRTHGHPAHVAPQPIALDVAHHTHHVLKHLPTDKCSEDKFGRRTCGYRS